MTGRLALAMAGFLCKNSRPLPLPRFYVYGGASDGEKDAKTQRLKVPPHSFEANSPYWAA